MPVTGINLSALGTYSEVGDRSKLNISRSSRQKKGINYFVYPQDLENTDELPHAVYFYINIREKSKYKKYDEYAASAVGGQITDAPAGGSLTPQQLKNTGKIQGSVAIGTVAGTATSSVLGGGIGGALLGAAVAAGIGFSANELLSKADEVLTRYGDTALKTDTPKRITDVIALPIESKPVVKYSVGYSTADMGFYAGLSKSLDDNASFSFSKPGAVIDATTRFLAAVAQAPTIAGLPNPIQTLLRAGSTSINPYKEVFFEGVNFRTFNFSYTFLPRNASEILEVKDIIDLFKFHMHPEYSGQDTATNFLLYPSFFNIEYHFKEEKNRFINKIGNCVLTDMSVNYGGDYFTSFENGAPAEIYLRLTFQETELLTKEKILEGY